MSFFKNNEAALYYPFEWLIQERQVELLSYEFADFKKDRTDRWSRMFFRYLTSITNDNKGSFKFIFDDSVLSLSSDEQEKLNEILFELVGQTNWSENWGLISSIEENVSDYSKEDFSNGNFFLKYIESSIACGYSLSKRKLLIIFSEHMSEEEVEKFTLLSRINNPNNWNY